MISIKMFNGKWRLIITNEEWEFKDDDAFEKTLLQILRLKNTFGLLQKVS